MKPEKKLQIRNSTAEFLIFTRQAGEDGIEVRVAEETVWLTQKLIGVLFDKSRSTITEHLKNIFETGELDEKAVCRKSRHTALSANSPVSKIFVRCSVMVLRPLSKSTLINFWVSQTVSSATRTSMPASPACRVKIRNSAVLLRIWIFFSLLMV